MISDFGLQFPLKIQNKSQKRNLNSLNNHRSKTTTTTTTNYLANLNKEVVIVLASKNFSDAVYSVPGNSLIDIGISQNPEIVFN